MTGHDVGLTQDAGYQIGVSRTLDGDPERVWQLLTSPAGQAMWLGAGASLGRNRTDSFTTDDGAVGETRSYRELDRTTVAYRPRGRAGDTNVQVTVRPSANGRSSVRFHQERLADAAERARQRKH